MLQNLYSSVLSESGKEKIERTIIWTAIGSFLIHLTVIGLVNLGWIELSFESELLTHPISAIYTPFSFILLFEVYLLVYHIPQSTSDYIAKQYEIITLIIIRRIFKDLANLDLSINWFQDKYDLQFTYDILSTLILFLLIYFFHRINEKSEQTLSFNELPTDIRRFIERKKAVALLLVPVFIAMALYSFGVWSFDWLYLIEEEAYQEHKFADINSIFFDEFFTVLILTDVLLLLFSFFHTSSFHIFIRNSGFVISTILIRISFGVDGVINNLLIIVAVLFGLLILWITKKYGKLEEKRLKV